MCLGEVRHVAEPKPLSQVSGNQFIPLKTEHAAVMLRTGRLQRYEKLVIESAKQCRRAYLMRVGHLAAAKRVLILVGPEDGWTNGELQLAAAHNGFPWCVGPHQMRIETAAVETTVVARYLARSSL